MFRRLDILVTPGVDQPGGTLTIGGDATSVVLGGATTLTTIGDRLIITDTLRINTAGGASNGYLSFGEQGGNGRTIAARLTAGDTLSNIDFASRTFHNSGIILPSTASIDSNAVSALNIGTSSQNQLNLGRATINTDLLGIPRIDGTVSAAISPLKTVAAIYETAAGQSIADATAFVKINYGTLVVDTDSAVSNAGTNWLFTVPTGKGGLYAIDASCSVPLPATTGQDHVMALSVNGAFVYEGERNFYQTGAGASEVHPVLNTVWKLAAGDTVYVGVYQASGAARNLSASATKNRVAIVRIPGS